MGLFFMIAGCFTPGSYDRKGHRRFLKERLLRLGIADFCSAVLRLGQYHSQASAGKKDTLDNQHSVAVGVETVSLLDGVPVCGEDVFKPRESPYQR